MRKKWIVAVGILVVAGNVWAAAPTISFDAVHPAMNAPLNVNSSPVSYGVKTVDYGGWTFDGVSATVTVPSVPYSSGLRYWTTLKDNATAVEPAMDSDWAFELTYKHTGGFVESVPWSVRHVSYPNGSLYEHRVFCLWHTSASSWSLKVGDATGDGWVDAVTGLNLGETFHKFTLHFKAANQRLDIYVDDVLRAQDVALGHGQYKPNFIQLEDADAVGTDSYGYAKLGPLAVSGNSHAIADSLGSSNGSSIINVVTYYQEHSSDYPDINLGSPTGSNWSGLIQDVINTMDASRGRIIFFPGGLYRCSGTINVNKPASAPLTLLGVGHASANMNFEGSVLKFEGATHLFKLYGPMSNFNLKDLQIEGPGVQNDQTAVRADIAGGNVTRCTFENLKMELFNRGFYFPGDADGMAFRDIRFANINRCIYLQRADAVVIEHIEGEPFYEYMLYLDQCSGVMVNNVLAVSTTTTPTRAFILTGSGTAGKSIEINGVHAEFVNNLATVTCPNVSLKNIYYYSTPGDPVHDDAFVFAQVSDQQPENCLIENVTFELNCDRNGTKDISLRTGGTVNLIESTPTAGAGSSCNGLRIINSEMDLSGIPTTNLIEKHSRGEQWVGNQLKRTYGTAMPTYAGNQGDIVWNIAPSAGGYVGWTCVGGSTWKGFGRIAN